MKKDDPKKPLPRPEWSDDDARRREQERVSKLLDAESGSASAGAPEDPEPFEVYGMPPGDAGLAPVYGMPAPGHEPQPMTAYGGPTMSRRPSSPAGLFIGLAAFALKSRAASTEARSAW
jgi:hypothetical protein